LVHACVVEIGPQNRLIAAGGEAKPIRDVDAAMEGWRQFRRSGAS
jgi:hypothetical protein